MPIFNMHGAKSQLSKLVERAANGEEVIIARNRKAIARIVPLEQPKGKRRKPGIWKGKIWMAPDFDELPEDIMKAFRGEMP